ncbi:MAG TPA: hypothetical protein EYP09_09170, partial [Anaerolineae bacterium]|nr:hypothetical protein [Anaerolineae bacterium]
MQKMVTMIKDEIAQLIAKAIKDAQERGELSAFDIPPIPLEHPKQAEHGDYATPICLQLAKLARTAPMRIAEVVAARLPQADYLGRVEVAPPGYINFTLDEGWLVRQVEEIQTLIGADRLIYQDLHGLIRSVRHNNSD